MEWIIKSELDNPEQRMEDGLELVSPLIRYKDCKWWEKQEDTNW